jgi:hypothetical protein
MKSTLAGALLVFANAFGQSPEETYKAAMVRVREQIEMAQAEYRRGFAESLRSAGRIELYIVSFDGFVEEPKPGWVVPDMPKNPIRVVRYGAVTGILDTRVIEDQADRKALLNALASQIAKARHTGGAFSHRPHYGIRIYPKRDASEPPVGPILESTFCWRCENFGFEYPDGSTAWLDTSAEMEKVFKRILPIPEQELGRYPKNPSNGQKKEEVVPPKGP